MTESEKPSTRWFRRLVKLALLAIVAAATVAFWPETVLEVRTSLVEQGKVEQWVASVQAGAVKAQRQASLRAMAAGRVAVLHIKRGDRVKAGQALLELDAGTLRARMRLSKANLKVGESAQRTTQVRKAAAARSLARNKKLAAKGAMATGTLERFQAEFDFASEAVQASLANMEQLKAALDVTRAALAETRIKAPFDALVSQVHVELGEAVNPATPLIDLVDDSSIRVEAPVDEADVGRLKLGMPVRVQTDVHANKPLTGTLSYISPVVIKDLRQNRQLNVEVALDVALAPMLKVGMSADIEIVVDRKPDVLFVPTAAVMRAGDQRQVYVVLGGKAEMRDIRIGLTNWERTEVVEGLRKGETIIINLDAESLAHGVPVRTGSGGASRVAY
ncbi:MAG: efflux RND transporter periplasmic adaptor subunit [Deltaproteobacteria bacterium]|nr:efflux RND transporter periplasmic adaptor subunit [Deltaproteobacteria bacterium]